MCGRGQLHLTVLIENMRREGFELMVGPPTVIDRMIDGVKCEPFEQVRVLSDHMDGSSILQYLERNEIIFGFIHTLSGRCDRAK